MLQDVSFSEDEQNKFLGHFLLVKVRLCTGTIKRGKNGKLTISEGHEVVQLYISDKKSSLPRPVKELKGFKKVKLAPGEEKDVTFTIDKEALSYFDDIQHTWVAEPGKFEAIIAASAADIKGVVPFELKQTC